MNSTFPISRKTFYDRERAFCSISQPGGWESQKSPEKKSVTNRKGLTDVPSGSPLLSPYREQLKSEQVCITEGRKEDGTKLSSFLSGVSPAYCITLSLHCIETDKAERIPSNGELVSKSH